ncbi:MAG: hypothetical protein RL580_2462, partial [Pseudomonadota bacterium]
MYLFPLGGRPFTIRGEFFQAGYPKMSASEAVVPYNDKVVRQFALMTVVWGVVG